MAGMREVEESHWPPRSPNLKPIDNYFSGLNEGSEWFSVHWKQNEFVTFKTQE